MEIRQRQTELVAFKLDKDLLEFIDNEAELFDTSRSEIIKAALRSYRVNYGGGK